MLVSRMNMATNQIEEVDFIARRKLTSYKFATPTGTGSAHLPIRLFLSYVSSLGSNSPLTKRNLYYDHVLDCQHRSDR